MHLFTFITFAKTSGLYYKHSTVINDDSSIINKFEASLADDARVIIYDCHRFIVQATEHNSFKVVELPTTNLCSVLNDSFPVLSCHPRS
jgi:hypothetical protein